MLTFETPTGSALIEPDAITAIIPMSPEVWGAPCCAVHISGGAAFTVKGTLADIGSSVRAALMSAAPAPSAPPIKSLRWRLRLARGFAAYCLHAPLHWASFALLPYAGDWIYRREVLPDDIEF